MRMIPEPEHAEHIARIARHADDMRGDALRSELFHGAVQHVKQFERVARFRRKRIVLKPGDALHELRQHGDSLIFRQFSKVRAQTGVLKQFGKVFAVSPRVLADIETC